MYQLTPAQERKEILRLYRVLMQSWRSNKGLKKHHKVRQAFEVSLSAHSTQRRVSGEPYIFHPLAVAIIVAGEMGLGETAIIAALLHDFIEDNPDINYREIIRNQFGEKIYSIVDGLTKIKDGYVTTETSAQAENTKRMLLTLSDDIRVILVKLADRLHNMRTMESMPDRKRKNIAGETLYLYTPLAHRLGLYAIKSELEDLSLKYTDPVVYNSILQKLQQTESERSRFIQQFIFPIKKALTEKGLSFVIDSREKSIYSINNKMIAKDIPFEEVYDLFAIRIILDVPQAEEELKCWDVYTTVTHIYRPKPNRLRDWISTPKTNGYESLHTTVVSGSGKFVEIQIRSRRMHEIAERGYAAHWKYKQQNDSEDSGLAGVEHWLAKIAEILNSPDSNALTLLDDIKLALYYDEVFVYTPKGHLKVLPSKSTILDFAYSIHSQLGNTCIAAKANHRLVSLNYQLRSGDQIEIISSKKGKPKEEWLNYVTTPRARSYITETLREERRSISGQGRQLLEQYFKESSLRMSRKNIQILMDYFGFTSPIDLYYKIAIKAITQSAIIECLNSPERSKIKDVIKSKTDIIQEKATEQHILMIKNAKKGVIPDLDNVNKSIAACCHPLPGDNVVTHLPIDGVYEVHRTNCPKAIELMSRFSNQLIHWTWTNRRLETYKSGLKISGIDRQNMLFDIIRLISQDLNFEIIAFHIDSSGQIFECYIVLNVHDIVDIDNLSTEIRKITGINSVSRMASFKE